MNNLDAQQKELDNNSFGIIVFNDSILGGTAFVLKNTKSIVTSLHVLHGSTNISYRPAKSYKDYKLKIKKVFEDLDIVILESAEPVCEVPLELSYDISTLGDIFNYIGYDSRESSKEWGTIQIKQSTIWAIGKKLRNQSVVDFIEFTGSGIPGYSGGPLLNSKGKVIGIMQEVWCYDVNIPNGTFRNTAYQLNFLEEHL